MRLLSIVLLFVALPSVVADPVIIGHAGMPLLDRTTLERIYMGRLVEVQGVRVTPINLPSGSVLRARFLRDYLAQDEDKYTGYWTVRRYVGKGTPPREVGSTAAVLDVVSRTEGAIGYVDEEEVRPGVQVLLRGVGLGIAAPK